MKKLFLIFISMFTFAFCTIDSAYAVDYPFSLTTSSISSGGTFQFMLSAQGTFYVDCGTGGTLSAANSTANAMISGGTINKTNTTRYTFKCTYSSAGTKTIRFGGTATNYNTGTTTEAISFFPPTNSSANAALITSISGNLSTIFPNLGSDLGQHPVFYQTFKRCSNLTSIPDTLFSGYTSGASNMFFSTFQDCTGLTSIPENLFSKITSGATGMFQYTFDNCTGLTSIPANLFSKITSGAKNMFNGTFSGCTGLTSIPANLFSNITTAADYMFYYTFCGCTSLTGTVPWTLFSGLIANGSPDATQMMINIFYNTGLSTTCPSNKKQYKTGYESTWSGKVACGDPITCASGKYLPAGSTTCNASCPSGYTCPAGTVGRNMKSDENKYAPITLTWDGNSTTPASCNVGGTFVPPTPAARPGYIFAGWRISCAGKIRNLDSSINNINGNNGMGAQNVSGSTFGAPLNYGLATGSGEWAAEFSYGTIWGKSRCSSTVGDHSSRTWPESSKSNWQKMNPANDNGTYCWCQATGFTASSYTSGPWCTVDSASYPWVFYYANSNYSGCASSCAKDCVYAVARYDYFRGPVFRALGQ